MTELFELCNKKMTKEEKEKSMRNDQNFSNFDQPDFKAYAYDKFGNTVLMTWKEYCEEKGL